MELLMGGHVYGGRGVFYVSLNIGVLLHDPDAAMHPGFL
jgi:hypothetical protein